jgi:hypothetical protein
MSAAAPVRQSVNLYLPEFRKQQDWLDAARMLQLAGLLLLGVALGLVWQVWQLERSERVLAAAEAQRAAAVAATGALRASFGPQTPSEELLEQSRQLESVLQERRVVLDFMGSGQLGNTRGFSPFLADLARYHVQGLSLKSIRLAEDGRSVVLSGEVLRAELVPMYLQALDRGKSFRGLSFQVLQIADSPVRSADAAGQQVFNFTVSTGN